jgi:hypothetical protein
MLDLSTQDIRRIRKWARTSIADRQARIDRLTLYPHEHGPFATANVLDGQHEDVSKLILAKELDEELLDRIETNPPEGV